jgi:hypothetical protein
MLLAQIQYTLSIVSTPVKIHIRNDTNSCFKEELWIPEISDVFLRYDYQYTWSVTFPKVKIMNPRCDDQYPVEIKLVDADFGPL